MNIFEAQKVYLQFCVDIEYAETSGKTRVQAVEEYAGKHTTETIVEAVEVLREQRDKDHQARLEWLRIVRMVNSQKYSMKGLLLNHLVMNINDNTRYCKEHLETEEKTKEIAFFQGRLAGYKELLNHLCGQFGLKQAFVEDTGEALPPIEKHTTPYIKKLWGELQALLNDVRWTSVLDSIESATEGMKNYLLFEADNARDLYICQSKREGMTVFRTLFESIEKEKALREKELDFDGDDGEEDTGTGLPPEREKLVGTLQDEADAPNDENDGDGE